MKRNCLTVLDKLFIRFINGMHNRIRIYEAEERISWDVFMKYDIWQYDTGNPW